MKSLLLNTKLLNAVLFQIGWFGCVLGGNFVAPIILIVLLLVHYKWIVRSNKEWILIGSVTCLGLVVDSLFSFVGVFSFQNSFFGLIPLWLICLWCVFATSLCHSMSWLQDRLILAAVLGGISGPTSYLAGSKLADVVIAEPVFQSLCIVGACWAVLFPLMMLAVKKVNSHD